VITANQSTNFVGGTKRRCPRLGLSDFSNEQFEVDHLFAWRLFVRATHLAPGRHRRRATLARFYAHLLSFRRRAVRRAAIAMANTVSQEVLDAFQDFQRARVLFVQRVANLARFPSNVALMQNAGIMNLLTPLLDDNVTSIQQGASVRAWRGGVEWRVLVARLRWVVLLLPAAAAALNSNASATASPRISKCRVPVPPPFYEDYDHARCSHCDAATARLFLPPPAAPAND
jgi:hypothetical protein